MSVARYFAHLPNPVHLAAWVDDLHVSMRTPAHPACAGHQGGCPVYVTAYETAVAMEAVWLAKARVCNLLLSSGKGHTVAQGGSFTGVHIDTWLCQYRMQTNLSPSATPFRTWVPQTSPLPGCWPGAGAGPRTTAAPLNTSFHLPLPLPGHPSGRKHVQPAPASTRGRGRRPTVQLGPISHGVGPHTRSPLAHGPGH